MGPIIVDAMGSGTDQCFTNRGNLLVIGSTVACTIGLTWGGTTAPWGSATVLVPLILGLVGLVVFKIYEATIATHPLVCDFSVSFFEYSLSLSSMAHTSSFRYRWR